PIDAGVGEQQGRVVRRDQRTGGHTGVPLLFEEAQEGFADFCAFHRFVRGKNGIGPASRAKRQRAVLYRPGPRTAGVSALSGNDRRRPHPQWWWPQSGPCTCSSSSAVMGSISSWMPTRLLASGRSTRLAYSVSPSSVSTPISSWPLPSC